MEVRVLLGVPPLQRGVTDLFCPVAQWMRAPLSDSGGRAFESRRDNHNLLVLTEGGAWWHATGPENRADLTVEGSTPSPSANFRWSFGGQCRAPTCTMRVPLLPPVCKTGVYETGRSADERFESSGAHHFGTEHASGFPLWWAYARHKRCFQPTSLEEESAMKQL